MTENVPKNGGNGAEVINPTRALNRFTQGKWKETPYDVNQKNP
jgi:hypothetical protein